jgi:hypothetical protein
MMSNTQNRTKIQFAICSFCRQLLNLKVFCACVKDVASNVTYNIAIDIIIMYGARPGKEFSPVSGSREYAPGENEIFFSLSVVQRSYTWGWYGSRRHGDDHVGGSAVNRILEEATTTHLYDSRKCSINTRVEQISKRNGYPLRPGEFNSLNAIHDNIHERSRHCSRH